MINYDAVVIGSGHNGLVTACYLARAGYSVCVLERKKKPGVIHFFRDLEQTFDSIGRVAPEDVGNYRNFVKFWRPVNQGVFNTFMAPPGAKNIAVELFKGQIRSRALFRKDERLSDVQRNACGDEF